MCEKNQIRARIIAGALYFSTTLAIAYELHPWLWSASGQTKYILCLSLVLFGIAFLLLFYKKSRLAYPVGLVASGLAWSVYDDLVKLIIQVIVHGDRRSFEWMKGDPEVRTSIAIMLLLTFATAFSMVQSSPARWHIRNVPIRERILPVVFLSCLIVGIVLIHAWSQPWMVGETHGVGAEIAIVHVKKHGREIHEMAVYVLRDQTYFLSFEDRSFFSLWPSCKIYRGGLSPEQYHHLMTLLDSSEIRALQTSRRSMPKDWSSETWYISVTHGRRPTQFLVYSSVDKGTPEAPRALVDWFYETENLQPITLQHNDPDSCSLFSDDTVKSWSR